MTETEGVQSFGADSSTRGLDAAHRITFQGFMEQIRAQRKALKVARRTTPNSSNSKPQGK